ncbi:hypothetical protein [Streptomyces sp. NPDC000410]|uniref:hypothetical protein n=1 Tax=Streptomyces sp. NPDC000410 TaxID=3154254 RepID=UPI003324BB61
MSLSAPPPPRRRIPRTRPRLRAALAALALAVSAAACDRAPADTGAHATPQAVDGGGLETHPYMAAPGRNSMHADSYASDTAPFPAPRNKHPKVTWASKALPDAPGEPAQCAGMVFLKDGTPVAHCGAASSRPALRVIDPDTLKDLALYPLPVRPSTIVARTSGDPSVMFGDTSGAYFYLDHRDRVVIADAAQHLQRIAVEEDAAGRWRFRQVDDWDLSRHLPNDCATAKNPSPKGECDPVTAAQPDWQGLIWWVTRGGRVGTVNPDTGAVKSIRLGGEGIQNSFAAGPDGVSIAGDRRLYQMRANRQGVPQIVWSQGYDRGERRKPGQIDQGTGTTPTLIGDDYVAITDNAEPRMHVNVYRRAADPGGERLVCSVPVFGDGRSATENSIVAWGDGMAVENNYGYESPRSVRGGRSVDGGVTRVDIDKNGAGCHVRWKSDERSPTVVMKLSRANGLLYLYTKQPSADGTDTWHLTGVDWKTGRTRYRVATGTGDAFNNNWSPISLAPDGTAYVSTFGGLLSVRDRGDTAR